MSRSLECEIVSRRIEFPRAKTKPEFFKGNFWSLIPDTIDTDPSILPDPADMKIEPASCLLPRAEPTESIILPELLETELPVEI